MDCFTYCSATDYYQFRLGCDRQCLYYAMLGHLSQRVLVLPEEDAIIIRLGKQKGLPTPIKGFNLEPDLGQYVTEVKAVLDGLE